MVQISEIDKQLHAYASECSRSLTGQVPQMADEQRVRACKGDGLGLLHCAHGQLCVRCRTRHVTMFRIQIFISQDILEKRKKNMTYSRGQRD